MEQAAGLPQQAVLWQQLLQVRTACQHSSRRVTAAARHVRRLYVIGSALICGCKACFVCCRSLWWCSGGCVLCVDHTPAPGLGSTHSPALWVCCCRPMQLEAINASLSGGFGFGRVYQHIFQWVTLQGGGAGVCVCSMLLCFCSAHSVEVAGSWKCCQWLQQPQLTCSLHPRMVGPPCYTAATRICSVALQARTSSC